MGSCNFNDSNPLSKVKDWFILLNYNENQNLLDFDNLDKYQMAIFDPDAFLPFFEIRRSMLIMGYVSLGEASDYRTWFDKVKDKPFVLKENPNWKGDYYVDVRNKEWGDLIINVIIPPLIDKGFNGIFMDTLDTAIYLEGKDPKKFQGSKQAMINLVKRIKNTYPDLLLISNNGIELIDAIASSIDGVLVEDIYSIIDFENDGYKRVSVEDSRYKVNELKRIQKKYSLPIFVIDYTNNDNERERKILIKKSKENGFIPYVAEKKLNRIYEQ